MSRLLDHVIANPAMSGGLVVMALTAAAVVSNAVFLQKARHPEPWFMTRPAAVDAMLPDAPPVPVPRIRAEPPAHAMDSPAEVEVAVPVPTPAPMPSRQIPEKVVIEELQVKLAERGLYDGKVDGIPGTRTRAAIIAYEKSEGLPVTGEPSANVLDHINTASIQSPEPAANPPAAPAKQPSPGVEPLTPQPVKAVTSQPLDAGSVPSLEDAVASEIEIATQNRYRAVQHALNQIGYGPVAEDGRAGEGIDDAIRRFELDNGLPITGTPDDQVVDRLVAIGAMEAT